jgi:hypothetical protein
VIWGTDSFAVGRAPFPLPALYEVRTSESHGAIASDNDYIQGKTTCVQFGFYLDDYLLLLTPCSPPVCTPQIVYDIQTMRSKGFGFVNYANYGDATAAIAAMNGYVMGARTLQVSFKKSK